MEGDRGWYPRPHPGPLILFFNDHQGMRLREESYGRVGYVPTEGIDHLFPGTYFVEEVDSKYRRKYSRT